LRLRSPERLWKCTVSRPGLYAGTLFRELLVRYGTNVEGAVYEGQPSTAAAVLVGSYATRDLADILRFFLSESDNLTGECLLKALGASRCGPPGSAAQGITAVERTLSDIGIDDKSYALADGSGLSTYNLLSPDIVVRVLDKTRDDFSIFPEFLDALSIAGVNGTLKRRMGEGPLKGAVRGKTGNMSGVSCVCGYLKTRSGNLLAVSIMMNGFVGTSQPLRAAQDDILRALWENY
jgi:D-alanyl-D-alanine carboxypeptidase/D-alanyl-D-alanine-endopeptidase (penicillin-binding protein 4)